MKTKWIVFNQSQSPEFQRMIEDLADYIGPCDMYTGAVYASAAKSLRLHKVQQYRRRSILTRGLSWAAFLASIMARSIFHRGPHLVLAVTNPPFAPYLAYLLHKIRRWKYVVLVWDVYPEHMVHAGIIKDGGSIYRLWMRLHCRTLSSADAVIVLGKSMQDAVLRQLGGEAGKCRSVVVPNWTDCKRLRPKSKSANSLAVRFGQVGKTTVLYSGNMGSSHGLHAVVDCATRLRDNENIHFLMIGDGLARPDLETQVRQLALTNVTFLPRQRWEDLGDSLACGDIAIVTQAGGTEALSMPSKTYSLLAVGCAIAACTAPDSDLANLVRENQLGFVCPSGSGERLAQGIVELVKDPARLAACRARARHTAEVEYSHDVVFPKLLTILRPGEAF